jgi:hypothetical protein
MVKSISLRESTQFPPSHQIDENTVYKRTYLDSTGLTTNGLIQIINYRTNEVVSQYLRVGKHQIALTPQTSYDDSISKLEECIKLISNK